MPLSDPAALAQLDAIVGGCLVCTLRRASSCDNVLAWSDQFGSRCQSVMSTATPLILDVTA